MKNILKTGFIVISTLLALTSSFLFYSQYLKWQFNSEGRAFDPVEGTVYSDASFVWGIIAVVFFIPLALKVKTKI